MDIGFLISSSKERQAISKRVSKLINDNIVRTGTRIITIDRDIQCNYSGELDLNGNAFGYGLAVNINFPELSYKSTWLNNEIHGFCKQLIDTKYQTYFFLGVFNDESE